MYDQISLAHAEPMPQYLLDTLKRSPKLGSFLYGLLIYYDLHGVSEADCKVKMREILRIDDRGRIVIPKSAREYLGIDEKLDNLEKSTDTITLVAIISPESRALRLTSISTGNESLTNLVRSEEVSDARKKGVSELGEDMWNLTTTIVESALRSGDDVVPLEVNKAGRIHTNRVLRNALDLTPESYLIAIPFGRQDGVKELQIIPLLDSSEALIVRIILKDGVEWRIMTPIPEDPEALRKKLLKQKAVQRVDFFL